VIVFALDGTTLASSSHPTAGGWVNVVGGLAALLAAAMLRARPVHPKTQTSPSRIERLASGSAAYAVLAGIVLNLFPGVLPFFGLRNIAALETGNGVRVALIVVFYVIMFALIEVPLLGLLLAPQQVEPRVRRVNAWLDRNARLLEVRVLGIAGLFLLVRGAVQLAHG
jgi:cytochrome c biogenesis protein CcdA